jgi:hypothetical protein
LVEPLASDAAERWRLDPLRRDIAERMSLFVHWQKGTKCLIYGHKCRRMNTALIPLNRRTERDGIIYTLEEVLNRYGKASRKSELGQA